MDAGDFLDVYLWLMVVLIWLVAIYAINKLFF